MKMRQWTMGVVFFSFLGMAQGVFGLGVTDKSQVAFHKDDTGYVFLASGVDLKNYDTVVIGNFSIEGLPDLGPGKLESYRDSYRTQLKTKLSTAVIFKEVTDDQSKASGPNTNWSSGEIS
jgi:hypothetical protein